MMSPNVCDTSLVTPGGARRKWRAAEQQQAAIKCGAGVNEEFTLAHCTAAGSRRDGRQLIHWMGHTQCTNW